MIIDYLHVLQLYPMYASTNIGLWGIQFVGVGTLPRKRGCFISLCPSPTTHSGPTSCSYISSFVVRVPGAALVPPSIDSMHQCSFSYGSCGLRTGARALQILSEKWSACRLLLYTVCICCRSLWWLRSSPCIRSGMLYLELMCYQLEILNAVYGLWQELDRFAFQFLNGDGDLFDLIDALDRDSIPDWNSMTSEEMRVKVNCYSR